MDEYCMYLRKSRADLEAEAHGEGETLARHEKLLFELAKRREFNVTKIYREIVSGETIAARPVMQQLLQDVEQGVWAGVLVVELERLARGDTMDQGLVAQTFKYSETKIVTPLKDYDPTDEYDEEYFEFGLFMSRREYKTINRRLNRGRLAAAREGKWVSGLPPYGYECVRVKNGKGWTLQIKEDEAEIVRFIFKLYTSGNDTGENAGKGLGTYPICLQLDKMGVSPPRSAACWSDRTIRQMLQNPVYIGKIRYNYHKKKRRMVDGSPKTEYYTSSPEDTILVDGLHPAIVDKDVFARAQELFAQRGHSPVPSMLPPINPLAGLAVCGKCGRVLSMYSYGKKKYLRCVNRACDNVSSKYDVVEERLLQSLSQWLDEYRLDWGNGLPEKEQETIALKRRALKKASAEVETLRKQLGKTYDLLEQGVYNSDTFLLRSHELSGRISAAEENVRALSAGLDGDLRLASNRKNIVPKVEKLLELYPMLPSPVAKNDMLKSILQKVVYTKLEKSGRGGPFDNFDLVLYPKLPPTDE